MNATKSKTWFGGLEVYSKVEDGEEILEGRRSSVREAMKLAKRRWKEYRCEKNPHIRILVRLDGILVADDPSDFITAGPWYRADH
jgi:hypothetical protein